MLNRLKMLSIDDVCEIANCHRDTVRIWHEIGIIKPIRTGKNIMFSQSEIERFQQDYKGYDVSNRIKALESYRAVTGKNSIL